MKVKYNRMKASSGKNNNAAELQRALAAADSLPMSERISSLRDGIMNEQRYASVERRYRTIAQATLLRTVCPPSFSQ